MTDLSTLFTQAAVFGLQALSLIMMLGIFVTFFIAAQTMYKNQTARWDLIAFMVVIALLVLWSLRVYPPQVIKSVRLAFQASRPEMLLLQDELYDWLPAVPTPAAAPEAEPSLVLDMATPAPNIVPPSPTPTQIRPPSIPVGPPAWMLRDGQPITLTPTATATPSAEPVEAEPTRWPPIPPTATATPSAEPVAEPAEAEVGGRP